MTSERKVKAFREGLNDLRDLKDLTIPSTEQALSLHARERDQCEKGSSFRGVQGRCSRGGKGEGHTRGDVHGRGRGGKRRGR